MTFDNPAIEIVLFLAVLVALGLVTAVAGGLARRLGVSPALGTAIVALVIAAGIVATADALERFGTRTTAEVLAKHETIGAYRSNWHRRTILDLRFAVAGRARPVSIALDVDTARFDALSEGGHVEVVYLRLLGLGELVALADQPLAARLASLANLASGGAELLAFVGLGLVLLVAAKLVLRLETPALVACGAALVVLALAARDVGDWLAEERAWAGGAHGRASAHVEQVYTETREHSDLGRLKRYRSLLLRPYQVVVLAFDPAGGPGRVLAADEIDLGATPIARGAALEVEYPLAAPRAARIPGATRTHRWLNPLLSPVSLALVVLVAALVWHRRAQPRPARGN